MTNFKLPTENGIKHLPKPQGPFSVGWVDVFTAQRNEFLPGSGVKIQTTSKSNSYLV